MSLGVSEGILSVCTQPSPLHFSRYSLICDFEVHYTFELG